ncbi:hypothetical protein [Pleomorphomonas oryzae]|uniref:hypothetical protein n=1 Tax=Pleomorphomonas oryzae TaxID=261934 RepID=UPI00146BF0BF|nr:hypothetical protein [Pleomorphomonas oryzae]
MKPIAAMVSATAGEYRADESEERAGMSIIDERKAGRRWWTDDARIWWSFGSVGPSHATLNAKRTGRMRQASFNVR